MKRALKTKLKQLWFPAAFRLPEPEFGKEQLDLLEELIQLIHPTLTQAESAIKDERVQMAHFIVDLGTGIWRIRRKIKGLKRVPKEIKEALFSLESTWASMSEGGVEIVDHVGSIPPKNEARVVEVRDVPDIEKEQVIEALKPTILLHGEVVQRGEVVVGRPAPPKAEEAPLSTEDTPEDPPERPDGPEEKKNRG